MKYLLVPGHSIVRDKRGLRCSCGEYRPTGRTEAIRMSQLRDHKLAQIPARDDDGEAFLRTVREVAW